MMTKVQKQQIESLRKDGCTYKAIAEALGLSFDSVKCCCRRNGFTGSGHKKNIDACAECGTILQQLPGKRKKKFCSAKCRIAWWNKHKEQMNRKSAVEVICGYCGKTFTAYAGENRKYCSSVCYGKARSLKWEELSQ